MSESKPREPMLRLHFEGHEYVLKSAYDLLVKERDEFAERLKDYEKQIRESVLCGRDKATFHELRNERDELREALKLHGDDYVKQVGTWKIIQRLEEERDQALREIADE